MELTKQEKIKALKYVLECIENEKRDCHKTIGMCTYLRQKILEMKNIYFMGVSCLSEYIPEFVNKNNIHSGYWFPENDFESRIDYLKNLIEKLKMETENLNSKIENLETELNLIIKNNSDSIYLSKKRFVELLATEIQFYEFINFSQKQIERSQKEISKYLNL